MNSTGTGSECGVILDGKYEAQEGDRVECFTVVKS